MRLYLAGPMRRIEAFNFPEFDRVTILLREAGYTVFSPAENDRMMGFNPQGMTGHEDSGFDLRVMLAADLQYICLQAEGIALLDGWRSSSGTRAEVGTGKAISITSQHYSKWIRWAHIVEEGQA